MSEFFDRMDRDYDGRLTYGEFMGEETALEKVFKNMDKDGDGTVSKEVRHLVLSSRPSELNVVLRNLRSCANISLRNRWRKDSLSSILAEITSKRERERESYLNILTIFSRLDYREFCQMIHSKNKTG